MGFMLKNLTKGDYQIQFKKYSFGFDTFDFSAMLYADKHIKLIDIEESEIKKSKAKDQKKKENVGGSNTQTFTSSDDKKVSKKHFTKAGDQDTNEKRMIDILPHTQIDMEQQKADKSKDLELEEFK
jgi:hypothetical protein